MPLDLCLSCLSVGVCQRLNTLLVTVSELRNAEFLRDVRNGAAGFALTRDKVEQALLLYPGSFRSASGREVILSMRPFDKGGRYWWRDFCKPVPWQVRPKVRSEALGRVIVLSSVMKAYWPVKASLWGIRPANLNTEVKVLRQKWPASPMICPVHNQLLMSEQAGRRLFIKEKPANDNAKELDQA